VTHTRVDVISFGPDKPRRPLPRPPRRAVVAGLAAVTCAALLVAGIVMVRRGGGTEPGAAAEPSTAAEPARPSSAAETAQPSAVAPRPISPCSAPLEMAGLVIGGVPLEQGSTLERCDRKAADGPWTAVVRRHDGSLGSHGAVVTFPVALPAGGLPVTVNGVAGKAVGGSVTWPLAKSYARIRGDLDQAALLAIASRTTVAGGRPRVRPPAGYTVVASGPYRAPAVHEVRYGSDEVGEARALGGGLTYTVLSNGGGGFEDQLYLQGATPGGLVGGVPAVVSQVGGGNATLAWELEPGVVAYIGYSGGMLDDAAVAGLRRLAARARLVSLADWWFSNPTVQDEVNEPG
jgi:hypothetical protein